MLPIITKPDELARSNHFRVRIGSTPHQISGDEFLELARHSPGYSGSDIAMAVKAALMAPLQSSYYRKVAALGAKDVLFEPCKETDDGAVRMSVDDIPPNSLQAVPVTYAHIITALVRTFSDVLLAFSCTSLRSFAFVEFPWFHLSANNTLLQGMCKASVSAEDLGRYDDWTVQFGQNGI